jgi:hypothetical protein
MEGSMGVWNKVRGVFQWVYNMPIRILFVVTVFFMILLEVQGTPLKTDAAPWGIVSLEFAWTKEKVQAILESWKPVVGIANWQLGLDLLFLLFYPVFVSRLCRRIDWPCKKIVSWIALSALLWDFLENICLLVVLNQQRWFVLSILAGVFACLKFIVWGIGLLYLLWYALVSILKNLRLFFKQFNNFRFLLLFGSIVFFFPLSVISPTFSRMLGGLFVDLNQWQLFWGTVIATLFIYSMLIAQALIIDGILARYGGIERFRAMTIFNLQGPLSVSGVMKAIARSTRIDEAKSDLGQDSSTSQDSSRQKNLREKLDHYIPYSLDVAFGFPFEFGFILIAFVLFTPWAVVTFLNLDQKSNDWIALLLLGGGFIATTIVFYLIALVIDKCSWFNRPHSWIKELRHKPHMFAAISLLFIATVYAFVVPRVGESISPVGYFLVLLIALVWILGFIEFHLPVRGISPIFMLTIFLVAYAFLGASIGSNHFVFLTFPGLENSIQNVSIDAKAKDDQNQSLFANQKTNGNLVVVAVSGGGILSASWSTYWLYQLLNARPELACEIKLFSTASGGSVGMAHYLASLKMKSDRGDLPLCQAENNAEINQNEYLNSAETAYQKSTVSSLSSVTHAMAYSDLWRALSAGKIRLLGNLGDRGNKLENAWRQEATGSPNPQEAYRVGSFVTAIKDGIIPAFIFNSTILETGERVMITPLDFTEDQLHAKMISETLTGGKSQVDLDLFTAARLSATFPFVTPAAKADMICPENIEDPLQKTCNYHFLDGGYADNFGIQSTLDFLRNVLEKDRGKSIKRVLIIEMRLTNFKNEDNKPEPVNAFAADLYGPVKGFLNSGFIQGQIARNDIGLDNFIRDWKDKMAIEVLTIQPPKDVAGPLSWHLPVSQEEALFGKRGSWLVYSPDTFPLDSQGKLSCGKEYKAQNCALKEVFETWKDKDEQRRYKKDVNDDYVYVDCLRAMNDFLTKGQKFPPACTTRW